MDITFWVKVAQLILSLSILVFVHELGHFMFARLFKVRVNKFYLFFNPNFSIVRLKKINGKFQIRWFSKNLPEHVKPLLDEEGNPRFDKKGKPVMITASTDDLPDDDWRKYPETTEWGIGWLPLGGYCKIAGMVDETTDSTSLESEPQTWEYRSRPAWQRLFIITGGVLMNFLAAIVIYSMILFAWGDKYLPMQNAEMGYNYCQTALNNGFQNGDVIISVDGEKVELEKEAIEKILIEGKRNILIKRSDSLVSLLLPANFSEQLLVAEETSFITELRIPFVVETVVAGSPAEQIGLRAGDSIVALNGKKTSVFQEITKELSLLVSQKTPLSFYRNGELLNDTLQVSADGKMGVSIKNPMSYLEMESKEYGFFESFPAGINRGIDVLASYVKQLRLVFTKAGAKSIGGFGAIGSLFSERWDWLRFWNMTAFLSIILAFMNILPIPILDGGYVLFLLYEMITRRKPSDRFMEVALNIGMILLFALMIFANGNDIFRFFK